MRNLRVVVLTVLLSVTALSSRVFVQAPAGRAPNIDWDDTLSPALARALRLSPTFRRQWMRVGEIPYLEVHIHFVDWIPSGLAGAHARTILRRYHFGRIEADVQLKYGEDLHEWIAHEFEHVLEYAEGVDYRVLMRAQPGRVWIVGSNHFETRRAIDTGARVAREVSRGARGID